MAQLVDQGVPFVGLMAFYCILYIYIYIKIFCLLGRLYMRMSMLETLACTLNQVTQSIAKS